MTPPTESPVRYVETLLSGGLYQQLWLVQGLQET
jgi:hypothetical protein